MVDSPVPNTDPSQPQTPQAPQVALSNADDSANPRSIANQAPAYGDPGQPAAPPQSPQSLSPEIQHTSRFHKILSTMNQGDSQVMRGPDGNPLTDANGKVRTQPMSSKQMGRSILASALASMATMEQSQADRNGGPNNAGAAADKAFQQSHPAAQIRQAQEQSTVQKTQQYATYKQNVDMFKLAHEMSSMQTADRQAVAEPFKGAHDAGENGDIPGYDPQFGDMTEQETAEQSKTMDHTKYMLVPNGEVVPGPNGTSDMHYMRLPGTAGIPLTQEFIDAHPGQLKGAAPHNIPLPQYLKIAMRGASDVSMTATVNGLGETMKSTGEDGKPAEFDLAKFKKESHATPEQLSKLGGLSGDRTDPVAFDKALKAIDPTGQMDNALRNQGFKIDAPAWAEKQAVKIASDKNLQDKANKQQDLLTAPLNDSLAEDIQAEYTSAKDHNGIPEARYEVAKAFSEGKANTKAAAEQKLSDIKKDAEIDKEGLNGAADAIVNGGSLGKMSEYAAMGRSPAKTYLGNAIRTAAINAGKDPQFYSPAAMEAKADMYKQYTSDKPGSVGANIVSFDNYLGHTNEAMDAVQRLKGQMVRKTLGMVPILDQPISWLQDHVTANEDYKRFQAALIPVKKEFEAFLNNNRAEHTEDLQEMARTLNDTKQSPNQIMSALSEMTKSADVRLAGMGRKFQATMHQNFDDLVTPQGAAVLQRMGVDSTAVKGNAGYKPPQGKGAAAPAPPPGFAAVQPEQQPQ